MDVWVEFKNASKWQAEALFRNFFPCAEEEDEGLDSDMEGVVLPPPPTLTSSPQPPQSPSDTSGLSSLWGSMTPPFSSSSSILSSPLSTKSVLSPARGVEDFGSKNQAYLPPPVDENISSNHHSAKPLDNETLARLAKTFADAIPDEEFSVAALQGCESCFSLFCLYQADSWIAMIRSVEEQVTA
jgi:chaperone BCS1